ncbi:MAG: hypothetical protein U0K91_09100 [Acutalibacteraceae bacterium]|nr:hypothetical protein [Acutalibacteraceae bacterium]
MICEDPVIVFAADLTNDGVVDVTDLPIYLGINSGSIIINQASPY